LFGASVLVDGDEGNVGAAGVFLLAGENIFREYLYTDFHGAAKDTIHARLQDDPFADVDGEAEIHVVDGRGDDVAIGMTSSREGSGDVDQVHDAATEHFAEWVCVVRQYRFDDFGTRRAYWLSGQAGFGVDLFPVSGPLLRRVRHHEISFGAPIRGAWLTAQRPL